MKGLLLAALAAAARRRDARAALAFHEQAACNACHAEFRRPLLEKLYGL